MQQQYKKKFAGHYLFEVEIQEITEFVSCRLCINYWLTIVSILQDIIKFFF